MPSRFCNGLWDGWLIAGNTHNIFVIQNKLILPAYIHFKTILLCFNLSTHFPNTTKEFFRLLENISNNPLPASHPKDRVVNVCYHKFACTNVTPKRRNGVHFITHAPHCAWVIRKLEISTNDGQRVVERTIIDHFIKFNKDKNISRIKWLYYLCGLHGEHFSWI